MGFKYAKPGPPFNFLGTITESQKEALEKWVGKHKADFPDLTKFHQIRAHQLRKTSGMLETFYKSKDPWGRGLEPSFEKDPWQPGPDGHFFPTQRDDQGPANAVFDLRDRFQYPMAFDEEGQFRMNFLRTRFEFQEDVAQEMAEADKALKSAEAAHSTARENRVRCEAGVEQAVQALAVVNQRSQERLECPPENALALAEGSAITLPLVRRLMPA